MLKTNAIFSDKMVFQRNANVAVFGITDCEKVTVTFEGKTYIARITDENDIIAGISGRKWIAVINTDEFAVEKDDLPCSYSLQILGNDNDGNVEIIEFKDILLGEVWLAGGQSNMELELKDSDDGEKIALASDYEYIRFYNVPKISTVGKELFEAESQTFWKCVRGEDCKYMSAVAYYYAQKLYESIKVPIGIIDCYWGGTSATCWVEQDMLKDIDEVQGYIKGWEDEVNSKSDEQCVQEMDDYNASLTNWQKRLDELKQKKPDVDWVEINETVGPYPWPLPRVKTSPYRPFSLHKSMIKRVAPYGIKGFIYYQAEEDGERADYYCKLNTAVIQQWRKDFYIDGSQLEKPFYIMQLPMFIANNSEDDKQWCILREQQYQCSITNQNVGIAVISDCGEFDNIHPTDKRTPGYRMANQVLAKTYDSTEGLHNLICNKVNINANTCLLEFDNTYGGLYYRRSDGEKLTSKEEAIMLTDETNTVDIICGFEISNNGEEYYKPLIEVIDDTLLLKGDEGKEIVAVRYAWFNYGVANVYSKTGIPLMPFSYKK